MASSAHRIAIRGWVIALLSAASSVRLFRTHRVAMRSWTIALASLMLMVAPAWTQRRSPVESFDQLAGAAEAARRAGRFEQALALYRRALIARPDWAKGWWHVGTLLYERDLFAEAAAAFERTTTLDPKVGTAWVMLGLCEFKLSRHKDALAHIQRGRRLGTSSDPQFRRVMLYHEGLLLIGEGAFEQARRTLGLLSRDGVENEELVTALGLAALNRRFADLLAGDQRIKRLVQRVGWAENLAAQKRVDEALREYESLLADFPEERNVNYAFGRFLLDVRDNDRAALAFAREIELHPDNVAARLNFAALKARSDPQLALRHAEEAVKLNARLPLGHYLLGSLLLQTGQIARAIAELEIAQRALPDEPQIYFALARAYARANRLRDAERARAIFRRLTEERRSPESDGAEVPHTINQKDPR